MICSLNIYGPVTLVRIDLTYKNDCYQSKFVVYVLFMSCYYPPNAFVLGDVRCNYIPVRRTFSAAKCDVIEDM